MSPFDAICLVDGSGYIFRAFYALPPMTRPDGVPVNAVYGFTNMMMNLMQDNPCSHLVVVFDAKRENFRNAIYPAYKKNRREIPPELIPQFPLIRQATEALNIPWIEQEGFEADDLIATYTRLALEKGWGVRIISADKDLMQLKKDGVVLYDPMKKKLLTDEDLYKKFGVPANKIVDVQALMGDSTDNVPGAQGIGPKTAAELINKYGDLDNLLANLDAIPQEKRREGLRRDREQILISRQLVQLDTHVPVTRMPEDFTLKQPVPEKLAQFLAENGFKSLLGRVQTSAQQKSAAKEVDEGVCTLIQDEAIFKNWLADVRDELVLDVETAGQGYRHARLVGLALRIPGGKSCYIPLRHGLLQDTADLFAMNQIPKQISVTRVLSLLNPILTNPAILKIAHDMKYVMHILSREYGSTFQISPIADTMIMSAVLNGSNHEHGLAELAEIYLNGDIISEDQMFATGTDKTAMADMVPDQIASYTDKKTRAIIRLYHLFSERLKTEDPTRIYQDYDLPLVPILFKMEQVGIMIDKNKLAQTGRLFEEKLHFLTNEIHQLAGEEFNVNSPAQLGVILFEKMGLSGGKKSANGAWTTDVGVLEKLAADGVELARKVLEYRGFSKLKSTYTDALLTATGGDNRVHTSFSQIATNTGRLASSDPNLQNIPVRTADGKSTQLSTDGSREIVYGQSVHRNEFGIEKGTFFFLELSILLARRVTDYITGKCPV